MRGEILLWGKNYYVAIFLPWGEFYYIVVFPGGNTTMGGKLLYNTGRPGCNKVKPLSCIISWFHNYPSLVGNTITYLVSCRRSIEIWRVCKIYGRRGGAEPSIYFTNPPYFYRPSATDQISVFISSRTLNYVRSSQNWGKSKQTSYIYGRVLRAKM